MAKKYCKKSSLESIADEIRTRAGTNDTMTPAQMKTAVDNLVIPTQQPTSYINLGASNSPYTIPKGIHSGHGTVTVSTQSKTATLSANGSTVYPDSGKVLSSVTIPAKNTFSVAVGTLTPSDKATSISITGLSFQPKGIAVMVTNASSSYVLEPRAIVNISSINNTVDGCLTASSGYKGRVTGATVSFGSNSVSISNITATRNGSSVSPYFRNQEHSYFVWG